MPNVRFFRWESDYLAFSKEGETHEFEIKLSRRDFLKDKKKPKHHVLAMGAKHIERSPNYFSYVLPVGVARRYEVPDYAGVLEWRVDRGNVRVTTIQNAKQITTATACDSDWDYLVEKSNEKMITAWRLAK